MSRRLTKRDLRQLDRDEHGATSRVYRYIRDSYAELVARKVGRPGGPSWESFAQLLVSRGQTNGKGEPLTGDTARKLFCRVSREIEARPTHGPNRPTSAHRSRPRGDWQPPVTQAVKPVSPRTSLPPATPVQVQQGDAHLSERVRSQWAAIDEQFAYLDRHIIRPKQRT
jgi:hypothetical protein